MQITGIYQAMILDYVDICPPIIFSSRVSFFVFITLNDRKNELIFLSPLIVIWKFKLKKIQYFVLKPYNFRFLKFSAKMWLQFFLHISVLIHSFVWSSYVKICPLFITRTGQCDTSIWSHFDWKRFHSLCPSISSFYQKRDTAISRIF